MGYDIDADTDEMEAYLKNLRHVKSKLYEFTDLMKDQMDRDGWDDDNRRQYDAVLAEIIRDIYAIIEDFDPPIRQLEKILGRAKEIERCM